MSITIYSADGTTILAGGQAAGVGRDANVFFRPSAAGSYHIKIEPLVANLFGTDAVYGVGVSEAAETFLPLVAR